MLCSFCRVPSPNDKYNKFSEGFEISLFVLIEQLDANTLCFAADVCARTVDRCLTVNEDAFTRSRYRIHQERLHEQATTDDREDTMKIKKKKKEQNKKSR